MSLRIRRLIYAIFIILFVIIAPLMVFYTIGFRYNWQKSKIEQVGVLLLDVKPPSSQLFLDNALLPESRPLRLPDLLPNYYLVRAEKQGYFAWQKNLEVRSQESTVVYDIVLFKNQPPKFLLAGRLQTFSLSPSESLMVFIKNNTVFSRNLKNNQTETLAILPYEIDEPKIIWSPNERFFIVRSQKNASFAIVSALKKNKVISWHTFDLGPLSNAQWGDDNEHLYGLAEAKNRALYKINFANNTKKEIDKEVISFQVIDGRIYLTKNTQDKTHLYRYRQNLLTREPLEEIAPLPLGSYFIKDIRNNFLSVLDEKNQIYLIDLGDSKQPLWQLNGRYLSWGEGAKNNFLYYYDDEQLWLFNPKTKKSEMLTRLSGQLKQVLPIPRLPYLVLRVNNDLFLTELDDRGERNVITLLKPQNLNDALFDEKGANLYFSGKIDIDGEEGLFKMEIQ